MTEHPNKVFIKKAPHAFPLTKLGESRIYGSKTCIPIIFLVIIIALWIASIFIKVNVGLTFKSKLDFEFKKN